ncbi:hypothetical protein [Vibrio hippocampi]|uniref:Uncharacterized protein n=1 Tax=Vibrio hippocampi TaxID=654686 RepID=A0ABN8DFC0_9VIBR|nr:hypothetical protein [Vibrio hippocampi]CAH0524892.1 hypothetical protein VHP8226_00567 [Vibrio hippocampi]
MSDPISNDQIRQIEAAKELAQATLTSHNQIKSAYDALQARWFALREHYVGMGAEDTEQVVNSIQMQSQTLFELLENCQRQLDALSNPSSEEFECNQDG